MEMVPLMNILVQCELERLAAAENSNNPDNNILPPRLQVRPFNLKHILNLRCLDPVAMDLLVRLKGMIVWSSPTIPDLKVAHFKCISCSNAI
jgi:DNA replication licensing factor MCM4